MSVIGDIRSALRDALKAGIADVQVSRYALGNPTPPGLHILPPGAEYHKAFGAGLTELTFTVQAFAALSTDIGPQIWLDELIDETSERSVVAALEADSTLGGLVDDVTVTAVEPARLLVTASNQALLLSDWTVIVYLDGSS